MKRSIGIGLAALLAIAAFAPAAISQGKAVKLDAKMVAKGMAEAPAILQANNIPCTLGNALYVGGSTDPKTKVKSDAYEVACTGSLGLVVLATSAGAPQVFSCLQTNQPGPDGKVSNLACKLPENQDQAKALTPFAAKGGATCDVQKARAIGTSATNSYFEVSCAGGKGYILSTSNAPSVDKEVVATTCLAFEPGTNLACTLTDAAAQLAAVDTLNTAAAKNCTIKDKRYVLSAKDGSNYYEVACTDGKGYMYEEASNGSFKRALDCAAADFVGGGCKLTDSRAAATEQNGLYTRLAKAAGYECDVAKYGVLNGPAGVDTVELQCSNRADGAIAMFGKDAASTKVYDCVQSEIAGFRCSFTKVAPLLPKLSASLKGLKPDTSCVVADARVIGATADEGFVELSCTDGLAGYVLGINKADMKPKEALSCGQAKGIGGGCKLETNVNPKKS
jgi:predicted nucleic acid-binding Zn ribbon protein